MHDSVDDSDVPSVTLAGVIAQERLWGEVGGAESFTVPAKPSLVLTVIRELPVSPARTITLAGVAVRVKSVGVTVTLMVSVWEIEPLVAVMFTVKSPIEDPASVSLAYANPSVVN